MKRFRFSLIALAFASSTVVVARPKENWIFLVPPEIQYNQTSFSKSSSEQAQFTNLPFIFGLMTEDEQDGKGGLVKGKIISMPAPEYPQQAKEEGVEGTVVVQVTMDEEGKIIEANVNSGEPLLREAALAAARLARFTPTTVDGKPVKVTGTINYNFKMDKKDKAKYKKK